ncbi:FAD-dependent oxidoreductase [Plastoroseomonas hellenica]|uniref:FAD-dependent oxidoreductase n=1 Tax=Plastoroseomonas hellenica TaxID=2687306 RepID=UPI001BA91E3D|nr:FAD-dependent oxidoreductase [Plastoroseomonas hellenica]MBR0643095.1 FAD-dependent oxidoreductase [Plastoroseomonas hellenica]
MSGGTHDVIVLGGGCAGLFTAIAAGALGMDCLVLEAAPQLGGGTAISSGFLWVGGNHLHAEAGGADTPEAVWAYLAHVAGGGADPARMEAFAAMAPEALRAFEAAGIPFRLSPRIDHHGLAPGAMAGGRILDTPPVDAAVLGEWHDRIATPAGPLYRLGGSEAVRLGGANNVATWEAAAAVERERPGQRGAGAGLMTWLVAAALRHGVGIRTKAAAARLLVDAGRVTGVVTADGAQFAARRGVVLACGGYESNPALVDRFEALPGWQSMFPESLRGDGLVMATEHGAALHVVGNNLSVFLGFRNPEEAPGGTAPCRLSGTAELTAPHTMVVNREGRRFADESFFQAVAPHLRAFDVRRGEQPNLPCFLIFDAQYGARQSFAGRPPGAPIPPWVCRASSLADLAAQLGIDAEGLEATVRRFNADAGRGRDSEHHRGETPWGLARLGPAATLGPIEQAPFFGIRLHPTALASAGLLADSSARVLHTRGHPMPGLYAVGNAAARTETGAGYQTGYSLTSGMTFGLIAARDMAGLPHGVWSGSRPDGIIRADKNAR